MIKSRDTIRVVSWWIKDSMFELESLIDNRNARKNDNGMCFRLVFICVFKPVTIEDENKRSSRVFDKITIISRTEKRNKGLQQTFTNNASRNDFSVTFLFIFFFKSKSNAFRTGNNNSSTSSRVLPIYAAHNETYDVACTATVQSRRVQSSRRRSERKSSPADGRKWGEGR